LLSWYIVITMSPPRSRCCRQNLAQANQPYNHNITLITQHNTTQHNTTHQTTENTSESSGYNVNAVANASLAAVGGSFACAATRDNNSPKHSSINTKNQQNQQPYKQTFELKKFRLLRSAEKLEIRLVDHVQTGTRRVHIATSLRI
jgi:hypothetical protein